MLRLYRKPNKGLIGVDISSTSVKLLELSVKSGRYWVESYGLSPLLEGSVVEKNILNPEAVSDALERALNIANPQSQNVAVAVPTSMGFIKSSKWMRTWVMKSAKFRFEWMLSNTFRFPLMKSV